MPVHVAPYVGVWIETVTNNLISEASESHPMWVCGLKQIENSDITPSLLSHPMWVCGLKRRKEKEKILEVVAPYVGVWIETWSNLFAMINPDVAPYVGVWIETPIGTQRKNRSEGRTLCGCVD